MAIATPPVLPPPVTEPDPREREDWFQRLPPKAQEEARVVWRRREGRDEAIAERMRRFRTRSWIEGAVFLALMQGFFGSRSLLMIVPAAGLGAGLGALWYLLRAGRSLCVLTGGLTWSVLLLLEPISATVTLIKSVVVVCVLAAAIGVGRESWYRSDAIGW